MNKLNPNGRESVTEASSGVGQRIEDVSVTIFAWDDVPLVSYSDRNPAATGRSELGLLTLRTNEGVEGHAFLGSSIRGAYLDVISLVRNLKPRILGADPFERERLWNDLHSVSRATTMRAIGAMDIALWDVAGKIAGMSVGRMLGLYRTKIAAYASSPVFRTLDEYVEQAVWVKAAGYHGYKLHPPKELNAAIEACQLVRKAVGDDMRLMIDTGGIYDFTQAVRLGHAVEDLNYYWFEDPLADDDIYNYTKLRQKLSIPLMATEYSPGGFHSYASWITSQATDFLRGDVAVKGGLTGLVKAACLADAFRMNYEIHHGGNSLNNLAQLHVALAIRNTEYFEVLLPAAAQKYGLLRDIEMDEEGYFREPEGVGLCAALDHDRIKAKTIEVLR